MPHATHPLHCWTPRATTLALVASIFAGCSASEVEAVTSPIPATRTFILGTIDGIALPYTIPNCPMNTVVTSATLHLWSDHSYTLTVLGNRGGAASELSGDKGSWTDAGASIQLSGRDFDAAHPAPLVDNKVTATIAGTVLNSSSSSFSLQFTVVTGTRHPNDPDQPDQPNGPRQPK